MAKFGAGALAAAGRQGLKELGAALKPLPDSIQIDEQGTLGNLTPGEIAKGRDDEVSQAGKSGPEIDME